MEKGENLSHSPSACERVFSCVICCNCGTNQDILDHQQDHMPASGASNLLQPTHDHTGKTSGIQTESQVAKNTAEVAEPGVKHKGTKSGLAKNDMFSDYIHRAKMKIRTVSNLGSRKTASEAVDIHDTKKDNNSKDAFSDYINRAKMKIRKTSSVGRRKSNSLKKE